MMRIQILLQRMKKRKSTMMRRSTMKNAILKMRKETMRRMAKRKKGRKLWRALWDATRDKDQGSMLAV